MLKYDLPLMERGFALMLEGLGLDAASDPHLRDTPRRVAKAFAEDLCAGLFQAPPRIAEFTESYVPGMIVVSNITVTSLCAHHFLPFIGTAVVGYVPSHPRVLGLSKVARIVEYWSRRPQVQERLTSQIADHIADLVIDKTDPGNGGVGVVIRASHACTALRGVKHPAVMTTSELRGLFKIDPMARTEFLELARNSHS